ncbi:MAG: DUF2520 domain-containing protein [Cyclobacteriaceae bacterium]|nr:DUF2520 domain-containing protein [Cyclobacteriaceae bacterium]
MSKLVTFAGSGSLAWHLAPALDNTGYSVREVFSRNPASAKKLVGRLYEAEVKTSLDFSASDSRIFILAVADEAIEDVAREIILPEDSILVHTSGSQSLDRLGYAASSSTGVFYPLQVFSKNRKIDFDEVPILIETESKEVEHELIKMGRAISRQVQAVDANSRKAIHVASVFATNFTNHLLGISKEIMSNNNLDFNWLKPIIAESLNKSLTLGPEQSQGGPARLGNFETLDMHMEFLKEDEQLARLYRTLSQHIVDKYL